MDDILETSQYFYRQFYDKIKKFSSRFVNRFGISNIEYYTVSNSGQFNTLYLFAPDWLDIYCMEKLYLVDPYLRHPGDYRSGISFVECLEDERSLKIARLATNSNLPYSFNLRFDTPKGSENFGFALNSSCPRQHAKLIEELALIKLFIKRFREEFKPLINGMNESCVDLTHIIGSEFYQPVEKSLTLKKTLDYQLLEELGIALPVALTTREIEIIKELIKGLPASRIAKHLFISTKTVEHHLARIKEKFGSTSKTDLLLQVRELEEVGYFERQHRSPKISKQV